MSYLNNLRIVFAGDFQADVSTVNNDVRRYDNATFEKRFQEFQMRAPLNWNPIGSGAFRLINCQVKSVVIDGEEKNVDPAVDLFIGGSDNRVGGKMVDLDPQMQLVSALWGLTIRLTNGEQDILVGQFEPTSFRDYFLTRREGAYGSMAGSAACQSVLTNLQWSNDLLESTFLEKLKQVSPHELSIRLTAFGYSPIRNDDRFTFGTVVGAIGPYEENEPRSFVLGRRMVPKFDVVDETWSLLNNINFFDGWVDRANNSVLVDLGNALPMTHQLALKDIGSLQLAILKDVNTQESDELSEGDGFIALGDPIPYQTTDWLNKTSGIWSVPLSGDAANLIQDHPLALMQMLDDNHGKVLIRESINGLLVRADNFVQRVEPTETSQIKLFTSCYGQPLPNAEVSIDFSPPDNTAGDESSNDPSLSQTPIPETDLPKEALKNLPQTLTTEGDAQADLSIETQDPNNPRGYIDGQIYTLQYSLQGQENTQKHPLDAIYVLLFNSYPIPNHPTWFEHIQPIFQQYGNLYPIMSKRLVDLGDYDSVRQHRAILELSFSLDIYDPNSMPVTRDLSKAKRETILRWLRERYADGSYIMRLGQPKPKMVEETAPSAIETTSFQSLPSKPEAEDYNITHGDQNIKVALRRIQSDS